MIITQVKNPKWVTVKHGDLTAQIINCEVQTNEHGEEWLPFAATSHDTAPHGKKLWEDLNNGVYGSIADE